MKSIEKVNIPLYKLILPWKIKFDTYNIKMQLGTPIKGIHRTEGYMTINFHNFNDLSEVQNYFLDGNFMYKKQDLDLIVINTDCSSTMVSLKSARFSEINHEQLELQLLFDFHVFISGPEEAIPYIRDIKINQILD